MTTSQRFLRFFIGVGIGLLLSFFFFRDKASVVTSWLPTNRVKARVMESYLVPRPPTECLLQCHGLDWDSLMTFIPDSDVDFGNSKKEKEPKEYQLNNEDQSLSMRFAVRDSSVYLVELSRPGLECTCD